MQKFAHEQVGERSVWLVYDGQCPLCRRTAVALNIKKTFDQLYLIDARTNTAHPLMAEINRRQLDLDEGMVIYADGRFYHGQSALIFIAAYTDNTGWLARLNRRICRFPVVAEIVYPLMRAMRNGLLKIKGVNKIENLR